MTSRKAACSCGQLTLLAEGEPVRISMCHCLACQRRTGSVFGAQARFPGDSVRIKGDSTCYVRKADSGNRINFHFCPSCGSTVFYSLDDDPGIIAVPVGAFADPGFPPPTVSVYEDRMHSWVAVPEHFEHWD
ncbi:MAG: GFA family protein [Acidobacteriota bacterium]